MWQGILSISEKQDYQVCIKAFEAKLSPLNLPISKLSHTEQEVSTLEEADAADISNLDE